LGMVMVAVLSGDALLAWRRLESSAEYRVVFNSLSPKPAKPLAVRGPPRAATLALGPEGSAYRVPRDAAHVRLIPNAAAKAVCVIPTCSRMAFTSVVFGGCTTACRVLNRFSQSLFDTR